MAFEFDIPEDFMNSILQCDSEELCKNILKAGSKPLESSIKAEVPEETGDLKKSIKAGSPEQKNGVWQITVAPRGYSKHTFYGGKKRSRKYKLPHAAKLVFLEYGTSKQPARPLLTRATNNAEPEVLRKMQQEYERITEE